MNQFLCHGRKKCENRENDHDRLFSIFTEVASDKIGFLFFIVVFRLMLWRAAAFQPLIGKSFWLYGSGQRVRGLNRPLVRIAPLVEDLWGDLVDESSSIVTCLYGNEARQSH